MGLRVYCTVHKDEQLHRLVFHVGPKKGEKRTGGIGMSDIHYCRRCNKAYLVTVKIIPYEPKV